MVIYSCGAAQRAKPFSVHRFSNSTSCIGSGVISCCAWYPEINSTLYSVLAMSGGVGHFASYVNHSFAVAIDAAHCWFCRTHHGLQLIGLRSGHFGPRKGFRNGATDWAKLASHNAGGRTNADPARDWQVMIDQM